MYSMYSCSHIFVAMSCYLLLQDPQETPSEISETSEVLSPTDLRAITDVIPATPNESAIGGKQRNSEKKMENI